MTRKFWKTISYGPKASQKAGYTPASSRTEHQKGEQQKEDRNGNSRNRNRRLRNRNSSIGRTRMVTRGRKGSWHQDLPIFISHEGFVRLDWRREQEKERSLDYYLHSTSRMDTPSFLHCLATWPGYLQRLHSFESHGLRKRWHFEPSDLDKGYQQQREDMGYHALGPFSPNEYHRTTSDNLRRWKVGSRERLFTSWNKNRLIHHGEFQTKGHASTT